MNTQNEKITFFKGYRRGFETSRTIDDETLILDDMGFVAQRPTLPRSAKITSNGYGELSAWSA